MSETTGRPSTPPTPGESSEMRTFIYVSNPTVDYDEARLTGLLNRAREFNRANSITGALLFDGTTFVQCLEAPAVDMQSVTSRIFADPTHSNIVTLIDEPIRARSFSDWDMAYSRTQSDGALADSRARWAETVESAQAEPGQGGNAAFLREFWKHFVAEGPGPTR